MGTPVTSFPFPHVLFLDKNRILLSWVMKIQLNPWTKWVVNTQLIT